MGKMSISEQRSLYKRQKKNHQQRVCHHCKLVFNSGKSLGGHIKVHNKYKRNTDFALKKRNSNVETQDNTINHQVIDLLKFLHEFGWKVKKRRGSKSANTTKTLTTYDIKSQPAIPYCVKVNDYKGHGECEYDEDEEEDEDDGFTVMERLKFYGVSDNTHQISNTTRSYLCNTCDVYLPTFHALLIHVNDNSDFSGTTSSIEAKVQDVKAQLIMNVEDDHYKEVNWMGVEKYEVEVEHKVVMETKASAQVDEEEDFVIGNFVSIDEMGSNSNSRKMLNIDLNELPPSEN